jgi:hypothetical protein
MHGGQESSQEEGICALPSASLQCRRPSLNLQNASRGWHEIEKYKRKFIIYILNIGLNISPPRVSNSTLITQGFNLLVIYDEFEG